MRVHVYLYPFLHVHGMFETSYIARHFPYFAGEQMLAVKAKIYGVLYKQYSSIAFEETSSYWSVLKSS